MRTKVFTTIMLIKVIITGPLNAQCTWETQILDSYEYTTVVPHLVPGATIHNTPKSYAVYTGNFSLYMNMTNCNGGVGTCAGDTVYVRPMAVCPGLPVQLSAQLTTSFTGGAQCNVHLTVIDKNGTVLNEQDSVAAPFYPQWTLYTTGSITPQTDTITFILITNVNGGNGNDLSLDDYHLERCLLQTSSSASQAVCSNSDPLDLFSVIQNTPDTNGTWMGPSTLTGGYLGTFTPLVNANGTYVYHTAPYGNGNGCPQIDDSVNVTLVAAPQPDLGPDTTVCTGALLQLSPGTNPTYNYSWSTGSTGFAISVSSQVPDSTSYTVTVTAPNGCSESDTVIVEFASCTGINEHKNALVEIIPNPVTDFIQIKTEFIIQSLSIVNSAGQEVIRKESYLDDPVIDLSIIDQGLYLLIFESDKGSVLTKQFIKIR